MPSGGRSSPAAVLLLTAAAAAALGAARACTAAINGKRDCYGFSGELAPDATVAARRNPRTVLCAEDEQRCASIQCTLLKRTEDEEQFKYYGGCRDAIGRLFAINDKSKQKRPVNKHYDMQLGAQSKTSKRRVFKKKEGVDGYEVEKCVAYVCDTDFCNGAGGRQPPPTAVALAAAAAVLAARLLALY